MPLSKCPEREDGGPHQSISDDGIVYYCKNCGYQPPHQVKPRR